jgi:hypothetical protein
MTGVAAAVFAGGLRLHPQHPRRAREHARLLAQRFDTTAACISRLTSFLTFFPSTGAPPGFQRFHATINCTYLHGQSLQKSQRPILHG